MKHKFFDVTYNDPDKLWYAMISNTIMPLSKLLKQNKNPVGCGETAVEALQNLINKIGDQ